MTLRSLLQDPPPRIVALIERYRRWWPVFSFASGVASYLLVQRTDARAPWIAGLLALGWLWLLLEPWLARLRGYRLSWRLGRLLSQAVHQETLFFTLPFLLAATDWSSPQGLFTLTVAGAALVSIIDPVYNRRLRARRGPYLCFHAFTLFLAVLAVAPIVFRLDTARSYAWAVAIGTLGALPGLLHLYGRRRYWLGVPFAAALAGSAWLLQPWVAPVTLWLTEAAVVRSVDEARRLPGPALGHLEAGTLRRGVYAFTALHAPLGLREPVFHVWRFNGRVVDRIRLDIAGGRREGYRAWSRKQAFPDDPVGDWTVTVETAGGQRVGVLRFTVDRTR